MEACAIHENVGVASGVDVECQKTSDEIWIGK